MLGLALFSVYVRSKITEGRSLSKSGSGNSALVDLMGLNTSASAAPPDLEPSSLQALTQNMGISLLDDELMSLGKHKKTNQLSCKSTLRSLNFNKQKSKSAMSAQLSFFPLASVFSSPVGRLAETLHP